MKSVHNILSQRRFIIFVRGIISVALLIYLLTMIEWDRLTAILSELDKHFLFLAPIIFMIATLFAATRWYSLLLGLNIRQKIQQLYVYYMIGFFYGIFLPGVLGGDIVRIGLFVKKTRNSLAVIAASVFAERICGIITLFIIGAIAVSSLSSGLISDLGEPIITTIYIVAACFLSFLLGLLVIKAKFRTKCFSEDRKFWVTKKVVQLINVFLRLPYFTLLSLFLFSALVQATDILSSFVLAKSLNISVSLNLFFAIMPIVYISTVLPISLGGLGVREGVLVYLLTKVDILASDAIVLSFLIHVNRMVIGSIGGIIQIFWKGREEEI